MSDKNKIINDIKRLKDDLDKCKRQISLEVEKCFTEAGSRLGHLQPNPETIPKLIELVAQFMDIISQLLVALGL